MRTTKTIPGNPMKTKFLLTIAFLSASSGLSIAQPFPVTLDDIEGPYYAPDSPLKSDFRPDVSASTAENWPDLFVTGKVTDTAGYPLVNAKLDIWHADSLGNYDNSAVPGRDAPHDDRI